MTPRGIVLDMDGTLIDTPAAIAGVIVEVLDELGRPGVALGTVRSTIGRPLDVIFGQLLDLPADAPLVETGVTRYRRLFTERVQPRAADLVFPGVLATLTTWRESGLRLAIATSKIRKSADALLSGAGIMDLFDAVVCHDMVEHGKPHPAMGLRAAELLALPAADCVMVGDAVDDIRLGVAAGMATIGVTYGAADRNSLSEAGAGAVVDSFAEVGGVIRALGEAAGLADVTARREVMSG